MQSFVFSIEFFFFIKAILSIISLKFEIEVMGQSRVDIIIKENNEITLGR